MSDGKKKKIMGSFAKHQNWRIISRKGRSLAGKQHRRGMAHARVNGGGDAGGQAERKASNTGFATGARANR